jgi:HAD superfamily hydrolase (TIGR01509 family)
MLQALLCELEGVLVETAVARREALRRSFLRAGLALRPQIAEECAGLPVEAAVRHACARLGVMQDDTGIALLVLQAGREFTALMARGFAMAPGARDFVERAAACVPVAIVTRANRSETTFLLSLAGIDGLFACVVTADEVAAPKPAPDAHRHAMQRLSRRHPIALERTLALEDHPHGVRAAKAAGMRCVMVGDPTLTTMHAADAAIASLCAATPAALAAIVRRLREPVA